ncbi:hypothetical protein EII34_13310 [Arachnia propionica]|uniref:Uncharacterized protein n=1 Tax=Arachnia propionica TaxID=1750 RepID=A0A3P1T344_9ACTN|nr:hypothetical protein [Arachnia propionica]RRD03565.1 hypothetical protein EII34_13310 [Arachnia propionica]
MCRRTLSATATIVVLLGMVATPHWALADDNPCDPANGRYICDGSEDQPEGDRHPWRPPKLPDTGVADLPGIVLTP